MIFLPRSTFLPVVGFCVFKSGFCWSQNRDPAPGDKLGGRFGSCDLWPCSRGRCVRFRAWKVTGGRRWLRAVHLHQNCQTVIEVLIISERHFAVVFESWKLSLFRSCIVFYGVMKVVAYSRLAAILVLKYIEVSVAFPVGWGRCCPGKESEPSEATTGLREPLRDFWRVNHIISLG